MATVGNDQLRACTLETAELAVLCAETRASVFEICSTVNSGHIGGCSGAVELMVALYFGGILRINPANHEDTRRDRVLVRGHLGPLRYTILSRLGFLRADELTQYRQFGSRLHGHEDHTETPGVDITPSGSLGMVLSYGVGAAMAARGARSDYITYVFIGDGEEQEGNIAEAARHAAHLQLDNLIAVIDRNRKQLSVPTSATDSANLEAVWSGYGWSVIKLNDGHNISAVISAYNNARAAVGHGRPIVIVADTIKGFGLEGAESHFSGYHTTGTCTTDIITRAIDNLTANRALHADSASEAVGRFLSSSLPFRQPTGPFFRALPLSIKPRPETPNNPDLCQVEYFPQVGAYFARTGVAREDLFFLTADVTRDDHVRLLQLNEHWTFCNVGIREQHVVALAHGISVSRPTSRIVINSLDAFSYRFMDQINAAVHGKSSMVILGDVAGLTNARNGKTHQTSGQPAALTTMPGVTVLEPWDKEDTFRCLNWAIGESRGVVYVRLHSWTVSQVTNAERNLTQYIVRDCVKPDCVVVASGLTVDLAIAAASQLSAQGIEVRVINIVAHQLSVGFVHYLDSRCPLLTVYNGNAAVLLGSVAQRIMQVKGPKPTVAAGKGFNIGTTGGTEDLLRHFGLDAEGIVQAVSDLIS